MFSEKQSSRTGEQGDVRSRLSSECMCVKASSFEISKHARIYLQTLGAKFLVSLLCKMWK